MVRLFRFGQMEVVQIVVSYSKDTLVYAKFSDFSVLFMFLISPEGTVSGKSSAGIWLELTSDSAGEIKRLVEAQIKQVPVYFVGMEEIAG